nr:MAG TPA: hypothetical protein [Caudoviricetes sp.]
MESCSTVALIPIAPNAAVASVAVILALFTRSDNAYKKGPEFKLAPASISAKLPKLQASAASLTVYKSSKYL